MCLDYGADLATSRSSFATESTHSAQVVGLLEKILASTGEIHNEALQIIMHDGSSHSKRANLLL